jgi:hypothetical protein
MQQTRFIFAHYPDLLPGDITSRHIVTYINFFIKEHRVDREKKTSCHKCSVLAAVLLVG